MRMNKIARRKRQEFVMDKGSSSALFSNDDNYIVKEISFSFQTIDKNEIGWRFDFTAEEIEIIMRTYRQTVDHATARRKVVLSWWQKPPTRPDTSEVTFAE